MNKDMTNKKMKILIILPCYNEQDSIGKVLTELKKVQIENAEIVTLPVNDCSKDNTLAEIKKYSPQFLSNPVNLGIGGTVQNGLKYAHENDFDVAIQMDGDGQHPPMEVSKILVPIFNNEADFCIGSRFIDKEGFQSSFLRRVAIRFLTTLIKIRTGKTVLDCTSGYRAFNRKAIHECVIYYPKNFPEPESVLYMNKRGLRIKEVPVVMEARTTGVSSLGGLKGIRRTLYVAWALITLKVQN